MNIITEILLNIVLTWVITGKILEIVELFLNNRKSKETSKEYNLSAQGDWIRRGHTGEAKPPPVAPKVP